MRLIFNFLEYAIEAYDKVTAIGDQTYANEYDEWQLILAYFVSCAS